MIQLELVLDKGIKMKSLLSIILVLIIPIFGISGNNNNKVDSLEVYDIKLSDYPTKSDLIEALKPKKEFYYEPISDSLLSNYSTEFILDSLTSIKMYQIRFLMSGTDLLKYSSSPFFYNLTYELIYRNDFCSVFTDKFKNISTSNIPSAKEISVMYLLLSHSFIWNMFSENQKLGIIKMIVQRKRDGYSQDALILLMYKILKYEHLYPVNPKKYIYLYAGDIVFEIGNMDKMYDILKDYLKTKE